MISNGGLTFIASAHIDDYDNVPLTIRQRLLSWPWRPWVKAKQVHNPKFYQAGNRIYCSYQSLKDLEAK